MTTIVTRAGKGSPLTHTEVDTNFTNLNTNKLEAGAIALGSAATPSISFTGDTNTGIYSPGADQVAVATNGVERVEFGASEVVFNDGGTDYDFRIESDTNANLFFVDASANAVGIGTSAPATLLDVGGNGTAIIRVSNTNPGMGEDVLIGGYEFHKADASGSGAGVVGAVRMRSADSVGSSAYMTFSTALGGTANDVERVRITGAGLVGIGVTSPANQLQLSTDSAGKPSTNTWTIVSDERIKEDIELADLDLCYEAVKTIPLKRFKWKDEVYTEEQVRDRRKLGWIAQDVEAIFPKAVGTHEFKYNQVFEETIIPAIQEVLDDEGNVTTPAQPERIEKGELISEDVIEDCRDLNSDQLYAAMYGAIQKLMAKVETLEAEVEALKAA